MEKKSVLVMWDYSAYPLWSNGPMQANLPSGAVPLSAELRHDVEAWAEDMELLMAPGAAHKPKWEPPEQELAELNHRGLALAQRLKDELGSEWSVTYHDEVTSERIELHATPTVSRRRHGRRR